MFLLGLNNAAGLTSSYNLLHIKISVFKYINSLFYKTDDKISTTSPLFPSISKSAIINLGNSKFQSKNPVNCAADDLELSLAGSNDQIEFFSNFINPVASNYHQHNAGDNSVSSSLSSSNILPGQTMNSNGYLATSHNGLPEFDDFYDTHSYQTSAYNNNVDFQSDVYSGTGNHSTVNSQPIPQLFPQVNLDFFEFNSKNNLSVHPNASLAHQHMQRQVHQMHQPGPEENIHFNANMPGLNGNSPYFNDFSVKSANSTHSQLNKFEELISNSSLSSSESHISPLDDEFFKKIANNYTQQMEQKLNNFDLGSATTQAARKRKMVAPKTNGSVSALKKCKKELIITPAEFSVSSALPAPVSSTIANKQPINSRRRSSTALYNSKGEAVFSCTHCDATFKVKGYLTRHLKKHSTAKAFKCPFFQAPSDGQAGTKCHPSGGFSRRDTYKTHLKALHFIYPPGTKLNERNTTSGRCAGCFQYFENNFSWFEKHIEAGTCKGTVNYLEKGTDEPNETTTTIKEEEDDDDKEIRVKRESFDDNESIGNGFEDMHQQHQFILHDLVD